jgi:hypothetical protein
MPTIGEGLASQFERTWFMLRDVVRRMPDERWRADEDPKLTPARWALHIVEAADAYEREGFEDHEWGSRFCDWEGGAEEELPTQEQLLEYLDEVAARLEERLRGMSDGDMMAAPPYSWVGATNLERWLYALRHTHSHLGELNMLLRVHGAPSGDWR